MTRAEVHKVIMEWQISQSLKSKDKILTFYNQFIMDFPAFVFGMRDYDFQMDFYTSVLERFDSILLQYDPNIAQFETFFSQSLRFHYFKFLKKNKSRYIQTKNIGESINNIIDINFSLPESNQKIENQIKNTKLDKSFSRIKQPLNYIVVKCYYIDSFNEDDFIKLKEITNYKYSLCLKFIDTLMKETFQKKKRAIKFEKRLTNVYQKILDCHRKTRQIKSQENLYSYRELKNQELILKEKQSMYLDIYKKVVIHPPQKVIADFFNIDEKKVSNIILYFQRQFKIKELNRKKEA